MSFSDVSGASKYFVTPNEGFSTTTSGTVASGATTVGLNSVSGLTNGTTFVGVIEPAGTKEQIFTGVVDTSGSQITGVVWTKGSNIDHATGVSVVDYDTGTALKLMTTGLLKEHTQTGTHGAVTATSVNASGALTGTSLVNAVHTHANNAGGGQLTASAFANNAITAPLLATDAIKLGTPVTITSSQTISTISSNIALTNFSITATVPAGGRSVKGYLYIPNITATAATNATVKIWTGSVGGTQIQSGIVKLQDSGDAKFVMIPFYHTPSAGSITYVASLITDTNNVTASMSSTLPGIFLVENF